MTPAPFVPRKPWIGSRRWMRQPSVVVQNRETGEERFIGDAFHGNADGVPLRVLTSVCLADWRGEPRWQFQVSVSVIPPPKLAREASAAVSMALAMGGASALRGALYDPRTRDRRPTDAEVALVLRDFGMVGAEEDNHESGRARHFWKFCELRPGEAQGECECKATEEVIVEPDGHVWSRERSEEP